MTGAVGIMGIIFGALVSVPQIIKSLREKSTKGVSIRTYQLLWLAILCYLIRAIAIKAIIFIISNILNLCTTTIMLYLFHKYNSHQTFNSSLPFYLNKKKGPTQWYWGYKRKREI